MKNRKEEVIGLINNVQDILNKVLAIVDVESEDLELNVENPELDIEKTFQSFFEGESNKLARTAGLSIAEHPDKSKYNPLYVYGPSGCGKSHLINAIGVRYKEINPQKLVLYVTARQFQMEFTDSVRQNATKDFINCYQSIDMLIVDDIQEWMNAPKTLGTFFHVFNNLLRNGKQVIFACDRPPVDLQGMEERLLKRFACGLVVELEKPDMQLCIDFLNAKCHQSDLKIPSEVIEFIAKTANGSIYDLEGVMNSLKVYSTVNDSNIGMDIAERIIKRYIIQI
jgi:chromosomal replication initiator protein